MYVADLLDAMTVLGPKLAQIYGQGEAPMTITGMDKGMHVDDGHPRYRERIGSAGVARSEEHTSELQSLMRISYAVFCLTKKTHHIPYLDISETNQDITKPKANYTRRHIHK